MSAESWGELRTDQAWRDIDAGPGETQAPQFDPDAGQWPESVDIDYLVDSTRTIPGMGERPDSCGVWYPTEFCEECGEPQMGESRCSTRGCPECYTQWIRDRVEGEVTRLAAARHAESGIWKRAVHCVVSPPSGSVTTVDELREARRRAYDLAQQHGVRGGIAIEHGFRVKEDAHQLYRRLREIGEVDTSLWNWVRDHHMHWRELVYWSPHFHIIGLSRDFKPNSPDQDDGWVVERVSTLDEFDIDDPYSYESMIRCTWYQLSHATFDPRTNSHVATWFGDLAYNQFSPDDIAARDRRTIEDTIEDLLGPGGDQEGEGDDCDDDCCYREDCDGQLWPIWDAGRALQDQEFCDHIGREQQQRLTAAWEWAIGERQPPPGMKNPRTEREAWESFEAIL